LQQLDCADYLLSSEVAVEYKNSADFVNSLIDGRLLQQLKTLKKSFTKPIVLVEGNDIYSQRNVHPNAIRGLLSTVMVSYSIPVIFTKDAKESAAFLISMAKREQGESKGNFSLHFNKKVSSLKEQQEYLAEALPSVGADLAKKLLREFGSVKAIANASIEDLKKVDGVGEKIANSLKDVFSKGYQ
jgi:Fanconi anemia group M protein